MRSLQYNGVEYNSLSEACRSLDLNLSSMGRLMRKNKFSLEEAINYVNDKAFILGEKKYLTLRSLCAELDLEYPVVSKRLERGHSIENAIFQGRLSRKTITYKGKRYSSIVQGSKECGIELAARAIPSYMNRTGCSFEEAVDYYKSKLFTLKGQPYISIATACREFKISRKSIEYLVYKKGLTVEEAFIRKIDSGY